MSITVYDLTKFMTENNIPVTPITMRRTSSSTTSDRLENPDGNLELLDMEFFQTADGATNMVVLGCSDRAGIQFNGGWIVYSASALRRSLKITTGRFTRAEKDHLALYLQKHAILERLPERDPDETHENVYNPERIVWTRKLN